jgi:NADH-quinone oxidoreductase subunit G
MLSAAMVYERLCESVPFYEGIGLDEIGGRGVRWPEHDAAGRLPESPLPEAPPETPPDLAEGGLRLGTVRPLWSCRETEHAPVLRFLAPRQRAELAPEDARRMGLSSGDVVEVSVEGGPSVRAEVALLTGTPPGSVFLVETTGDDSATQLTNGAPRVVQVEALAPLRSEP